MRFLLKAFLFFSLFLFVPHLSFAESITARIFPGTRTTKFVGKLGGATRPTFEHLSKFYPNQAANVARFNSNLNSSNFSDFKQAVSDLKSASGQDFDQEEMDKLEEEVEEKKDEDEEDDKKKKPNNPEESKVQVKKENEEEHRKKLEELQQFAERLLNNPDLGDEFLNTSRISELGDLLQNPDADISGILNPDNYSSVQNFIESGDLGALEGVVSPETLTNYASKGADVLGNSGVLNNSTINNLGKDLLGGGDNKGLFGNNGNKGQGGGGGGGSGGGGGGGGGLGALQGLLGGLGQGLGQAAAQQAQQQPTATPTPQASQEPADETTERLTNSTLLERLLSGDLVSENPVVNTLIAMTLLNGGIENNDALTNSLLNSYLENIETIQAEEEQATEFDF